MRPPASGTAGMAHRLRLDTSRVIVLALLALAFALYLRYSFQFFLHDDEGNYAYAAWRISLGEAPYRDFYTPQMPVFLYWGGLVARALGRSFVPLRLATLAVSLAGAWLLYALNRQALGKPVALLSLGLFLVNPNVFHNARYYLPEAYMQLFQLAGFYAFVLGEKRRQLGLSALAGALFGLAILSKLFGALPLAGCFIYLLYACWRERRPFREMLTQDLVLGLSALLVAGVAALIFGRVTPYFFSAVFEHHMMQGAGMPLAERARKAIDLYRSYVLGQPVAVTLAGVGAIVTLWRRRALPSLLLWQVPSAATFMVVSRPLILRHLSYLAPTLATLVAVALLKLWEMRHRLPPLPASRRALPLTLIGGMALALAALAARPWLAKDRVDAALREDDSPRLAALIQSVAADGERVMSDYPGLNFLAARGSTYWAGGMSGGAALSGQIRGQMLIDELKKQDPAAVIIKVSGSDLQMASTQGYSRFRRYVQQHYVLADRFEYTCATAALEVYSRVDPLPLKPGLAYQSELVLEAARLSAAELRGGAGLDVDTRWRALQPMKRDYRASALLVDASGRQWAEAHLTLQNADKTPTSGWLAGEQAWAHYHLDLNAALPDGDYYLLVQPYEGDSGFLLPAGKADGLTIGGVPAIAKVHVLPAVGGPGAGGVTIERPLAGVSFGPYYDLLGYDVSASELRPGESVRVTLYWAYKEPSPVDYKVFVHLLDGSSQVQGQHDVVPAGGGAQTSGWVQGDVLVDHFDVPLEATAGKGTLRIEVGFYDLLTGRRLPLLRDGQPTGEDRLLLPATISVP